MSNPFFETWTTPFGAPPFDAISTADFKPAYVEALAAHQSEVSAIATQAEAPSFDNTIVALELQRAGAAARRCGVFAAGFGQYQR